ncbi:MAG TPA: hypothetical protein VGD26_10430, partial [Chitinophagaceae bacterium]
TDDHNLHIREHQAVLADPDLRLDDDLAERATAHLQEHFDILSNPALANMLLALGQTPIAAPPQPQMPPQGGEGAPPAASPQAGSPQDLMSNPQAQDVSVQQQAGGMVPAPAEPPAEFSELPQTGQENFNRLVGG